MVHVVMLPCREYMAVRQGRKWLAVVRGSVSG